MIATVSPSAMSMLTPARAVTAPKRLTMSPVVISDVFMPLIPSCLRCGLDSARTPEGVVLGIPSSGPGAAGTG